MQVAAEVRQDLVAFLQPLLDQLDAQIDRRLVRTWDESHHCYRKTCILAIPILYDEHSLVLIVARRGKGQPPWYLLTSEPMAEVKELWHIVLSYARR